MSKIILKLYIAGTSPRSIQAVSDMHRICDQAVEECDLSIIDILHHPEVAEEQNILATPTLVREIPLPVQRIVGDFSNRALVMNTLGLRPIRGLKTGKLDKAK